VSPDPTLRTTGSSRVDPARKPSPISPTVTTPSRTLAIPKVMISGLTLNTPTPTPLIEPTSRPTNRASRSALRVPSPLRLAAMYAARFAVSATDRSIPPVSMHSVWLAAKIASGQASSRIERTPPTVNRLGSNAPVTRYSTTSSPVSAITGRSASRVPTRLRGAGRGRGRRHRGRGRGQRHVVLRLSWIRPPTSTTPMRITPRATSA
jgi:hypothetical protein